MEGKKTRRDEGVALSLISNRGGTHSSVLLKVMASADKIVICTAFLKSSGEKLVDKLLIAALRRGASVEIFAGSNFYQTEPDALERLLTLFQTAAGNACLYLTELHGHSTFHPKLYWFTHEGKETLVVGSANLTAGGLLTNVELSLCVTVPQGSELSQSAKQFIADARARCIDGKPVGATQLAEYRRKYDIYKKHNKAAAKSAAAEVKGTSGLSDAKIHRYLKLYLKDESEHESWKVRTKNYKRAREVLDRMANARSMTRKRFMADYELLVGKKGEGHLWHSGSLFRAKNQVAGKHKLFLTMLRRMRQQRRDTPAAVFEEAMSAARKIPGLGVNVVTEMMSTFERRKYAALNQNPIRSLKELGYAFPSGLGKNSFSAANYQQFVNVLHELAKKNQFKDGLAKVDHFLNFIYWELKKQE